MSAATSHQTTPVRVPAAEVIGPATYVGPHRRRPLPPPAVLPASECFSPDDGEEDGRG